jgi:aldose 1-epimerase
MAASRYIPVGSTLIPTGKLEPVEGSAYDLRSMTRIGDRLALLEKGIDHCYVLDRSALGLQDFAEVSEPISGRSMRVATTLPGCQFYTGNFLAGISGKRGSLYDKHAGFCLETQLFPDSPNQPDFPSPVLEPGAVWMHETVYSFSAR